MRLNWQFSLMLLFSTLSNAQTVIYTSVTFPVKNPEPGILVYQLDSVERLEKSLFPALPGNPEEAERQARRIMQQPDWKAREAQLTAAYQALTDAWSLGIARVPAVVFDDRYVVYGTTDTTLAKQLIDKWREQQP